KKVFDHLSDGADRLVDKQAVRDRMPQVGQQEVRLRHIGAPSASTPDPGGPEPFGSEPEKSAEARAESEPAADHERHDARTSDSEPTDAAGDSESAAAEDDRSSHKSA